jgi:hypothetical protein
LPVACCLLPVACCLLPVACCLNSALASNQRFIIISIVYSAQAIRARGAYAKNAKKVRNAKHAKKYGAIEKKREGRGLKKKDPAAMPRARPFASQNAAKEV